MYKNSKWAEGLLARQKSDGSWGYFRTLSEPIPFHKAVRRTE